MKRRHHAYNPKRRIIPKSQWNPERGRAWADQARYTGNAEHKVRPGDYGLTPPCNPRPGKTLCDADQSFTQNEAQALLRQGLKRGMISVQMRNGWPQNVWAVSATTTPSGPPETVQVFEAQLSNRVTGEYHGYPMPRNDDFRQTVIEEWQRRGA